MKRKHSSVPSVIFGVFLILSAATATTSHAYSTIFSFGDSLSDTGNAGRFTDGLVWVETMAHSDGATLINYSVGGGTTAYDNYVGIPNSGLQAQIDAWTFSGVAPADTLVTLWAGANDLLIGPRYDGPVNIYSALEKLYTLGAREILVPNLPDIGATPAFMSQGTDTAANATAWTLWFNSELETKLQEFVNIHSDTTLYFLDAFSIFAAIPEEQRPGLFWIDGFHPSATGHELIAKSALQVLNPVPEPATCLLFSTGLAIAGIAGRRKKNSAG